MSAAARVVDELRARGDLVEPAPGLVTLRGAAARLVRALERALARIAGDAGCEEWRAAPALPLETLARARHFESFPHWLTVAGHLPDDAAALESRAASGDPAATARAAATEGAAALPSALCYHTYAALAGRRLDGDGVRATLHGTCWRWEGAATSPLERGWAFTMRELVRVGSAADVARFREEGTDAACALARDLSLDWEVAPATDPFYAPTARGRMLIQKMKGLKTELLLGIGDGRRIAAASFNDHERFFGECFDIHGADGLPAASGCVAYGVERWALAFMVAHGTDAERWPWSGSLDLAGSGTR